MSGQKRRTHAADLAEQLRFGIETMEAAAELLENAGAPQTEMQRTTVEGALRERDDAAAQLAAFRVQYDQAVAELEAQKAALEPRIEEAEKRARRAEVKAQSSATSSKRTDTRVTQLKEARDKARAKLREHKAATSKEIAQLRKSLAAERAEVARLRGLLRTAHGDDAAFIEALGLGDAPAAPGVEDDAEVEPVAEVDVVAEAAADLVPSSPAPEAPAQIHAPPKAPKPRADLVRQGRPAPPSEPKTSAPVRVPALVSTPEPEPIIEDDLQPLGEVAARVWVAVARVGADWIDSGSIARAARVKKVKVEQALRRLVARQLVMHRPEERRVAEAWRMAEGARRVRTKDDDIALVYTAWAGKDSGYTILGDPECAWCVTLTEARERINAIDLPKGVLC